MAFLAGYLLLHMHEQARPAGARAVALTRARRQDAFFSFVKVMYSESHNMRALFDGQSDAMSRCLKEFDNLVSLKLPDLYAHLVRLHA